MGGGFQNLLVQGLDRRTLLGGGLATLLLTRVRSSHASSYLTLRVRAPQLEARFRNWWNRAKGYAEDLVTSKHHGVVQFRHRLSVIPKDLGLIDFIGAVNDVVNAAAT